MPFIPRPNERPVYVPSPEAEHFAGTVMGWLAVASFVVAAILIMLGI